MKIPEFLDDLNIISKLGDNPGADNGLTAEGLKAKFDEGILALQRYLNSVLVAKLNEIFAEGGQLNEGLVMTGPINMNTQRLFGLNDPMDNTDAISMEYANKHYRLHVGDAAPQNRNVLWFNTSYSQNTEGASAVLSLNEDETGASVTAVVGDETYGVGNAAVTQGDEPGSYDFTIL